MVIIIIKSDVFNAVIIIIKYGVLSMVLIIIKYGVSMVIMIIECAVLNTVLGIIKNGVIMVMIVVEYGARQKMYQRCQYPNVGYLSLHVNICHHILLLSSSHISCLYIHLYYHCLLMIVIKNGHNDH